MHRMDDETLLKLKSQILKYLEAETMTDVERGRFLELPEGCRIRERAKILCQEKFVCGKNVWIGEGALLDAQGGLTIGDGTQVGLNVMIWSHTSHLQALSGKTGSLTDEDIVFKPTKIGSNCFIAGPSVIGPGVTIGDRVIISPLSFVERDLPDDAVYSPRREFKTQQRKLQSLQQAVGGLIDVVGRVSADHPAAHEELEKLRKLIERAM